ncbi:phosphotransacetylase family protein [Haloquadratum walsbyi]|jgi:BioD-like N-terminal domain of phosphotransacetylase|uniref:BioD-like N-terminal domain of phosphotransacetylase n=1 Tax=Haloquadratum walsbyi J07HQW2 TaxID=1238425 RepID=U1NCD4_9EURY|nr:phosphotransacetylase family protein [Haloquadratum walsbyi]ERG94343.1 MAG: BioD-like N-terminal domain of phosphotransacetylase [Haloquadratum walsbyi J07HQW2]
MTDTTTTLITATGESVGKTAITLAFARLATAGDQDVGYMKPKGTRLQSNVGKTLDQDPMLAREMLGLDAEMHQMEPVVYSPTFAEGVIRGTEDTGALRDRIATSFETLADGRDHVFVEGGEWRTGGVVELTDPDVAELLDARVILVAEYESPKDLDAVLAAADAFGDRLAGVVFNKVADAAYDSLGQDGIPFLKSRGVAVFGALPREKELAGVTVSALADELGADALTEGSTDVFVERFLVGAMGGDEALRYFRRARDTVVITGGDRADVQTAALGASGVKCLLLTGGHRPSGAVLGRAAEADTAVLAVNTNTATAIDRVESLIQGGRTSDARTVDRMAKLLDAHVDVDAVI